MIERITSQFHAVNSGDNYRAQGGEIPFPPSARCTLPISPGCVGGSRSISASYRPSAANVYFSILPRETAATIKDIKNYLLYRMNPVPVEFSPSDYQLDPVDLNFTRIFNLSHSEFHVRFESLSVDAIRRKLSAVR